MSVTERIKEIQAENKRRALENEAVRVESAQKKEKDEQERLKAREVRKDFVKTQSERVLKESGIFEMLIQIGKGLLQKSENHGIFHEPKENGEFFKFAWDYAPSQIVNGLITGYDYNSIGIQINPDTESIIIYVCKYLHGFDHASGKPYAPEKIEFQKNEWQENKSLIEESLAESFAYPNTNPYYPPGGMQDPNWSLN